MKARPSALAVVVSSVLSSVVAIASAGCTSSTGTSSTGTSSTGTSASGAPPASGEVEGDGRGSVRFTTWGEAYIEEGIPESAFEDGWSVTFRRFLIVLRDVRIADDEGNVAAVSEKPLVFDLVRKGIKPVATFTNLPGRPWTDVSYRVGPMTADAEPGAGATEAAVEALREANAAVLVEGTATRGARTKTFLWGFATPTLMAECRGEKDGKEVRGVVVTNGGTDEVQLTIHGDHLFYDDLQAPGAALRFEAIARADDAGDGDGRVTLAELGAVRLATIPRELGGYGTGAAGNVNDLKAFVTALSRTLGHFRGEGECFAKASPT